MYKKGILPELKLELMKWRRVGFKIVNREENSELKKKKMWIFFNKVFLTLEINNLKSQTSKSFLQKKNVYV